jgi:hypothetical protein
MLDPARASEARQLAGREREALISRALRPTAHSLGPLTQPGSRAATAESTGPRTSSGHSRIGSLSSEAASVSAAGPGSRSSSGRVDPGRIPARGRPIAQCSRSKTSQTTSHSAATAKNQDDQRIVRPFPQPVITYAPRSPTAASKLRPARRGRASEATPQRSTPSAQPPRRTQRGRRGPASAALSFRGSDIDGRVRHELITLLGRTRLSATTSTGGHRVPEQGQLPTREGIEPRSTQVLAGVSPSPAPVAGLRCTTTQAITAAAATTASAANGNPL